MKTYRVVQTVAGFEYPKGKIWGPYVEKKDAEERVKTLQRFNGDGLIGYGEFGEPCQMRFPGTGV